MQIEDNRTESTIVRRIDAGECFSLDDKIYLKTDKEEMNGCTIIEISSGCVMWISKEAHATPLNCKFVIED